MDSSTFFDIKLCFTIFFLIQYGLASAQLSPNFYLKSCPKTLSTIKAVVDSVVSQERRMGASLLRLHFHDCFVNGCDGSVLLDSTASITGEKSAGANINSLRGYKVVDRMKSHLERICPGVVSCADILAIAARDSVVALGGSSWTVRLGRRDSTTASLSAANSQLPSPLANLTSLISLFSSKGLSAKDLAALSGSHTIGMARCTTFRGRIYKDTNINKVFAKSLMSKCPSSGGDSILSPLDTTPNTFDSSYYTNLLKLKGLLHSDQALFSGGGGFFDSQVKAYSVNSASFFIDFGKAMIKMGDISPLTGTKGQIRTNCRKVNSG